MARGKHNSKWFVTSFKILAATVLAATLVFEIYMGVTKLKAKEMTYISSTTMEEPIIYPTVTLCITMDMEFNGGPMSQNWMTPEKYNFSFPFEDFGLVEDRFSDM